MKKPDALPKWVSHTKSNTETWSGVGIGLTREVAIKQATNAIASQISMQIESNIKSIKVEQNIDIVNIHKAQGAIEALRKLKQLRDEVNSIG